MKKYKFRALVKPLDEVVELRGFVYESENVISLYTMDNRLLSFRVDEIELELCTGFFDKSLKPQLVFQNDILEHPASGERFAVLWIRDSFKAVYDWTQKHPCHISDFPLQIGDKGLAVVIGNIHKGKFEC